MDVLTTMKDFNNLTWTCHICRRVRDDADISVYTRDVSREYGLKPGTMQLNTRYCNDNPDCMKGAQERRRLE